MTVELEPVHIESGAISGIELDSGVRAWLGVPFAAPPVRELRWRPPMPATHWQGVYRADRCAPMSLQPLRNRKMNHYFGDEATSEDCLYLNIWAPEIKSTQAQLLPVVVWIYGGAFSIGSASMANYSGAPLAEKGVVRVNLSYRLGTLGFLSHPELTQEGDGSSGNYGLMDQIFALEWIRRNIEAFGGDPKNVTIVGQSAGSYSVAMLQASPIAAGLFHRVIGMSGSPLDGSTRGRSLASAERAGIRLQERLECANLEEMRDLSADVVMAAVFPDRMPVAIDGKVLVEAIGETFDSQRHNDVPAMLGFTSDESLWSIGKATTVSEFQSRVQAFFPERFQEILDCYVVENDEDICHAIRQIDRDCSVGWPMLSWAQGQTSNVYVWLFNRRQPYVDGIAFNDHDPVTAGAYHGADMPYWLGTLDSLNLFRMTREWTLMDQELSAWMMDCIVSFATHGTPTPKWPRFTSKDPKVLVLGENIHEELWPNYQVLNALTLGQRAPIVSTKLRD